MGTKHNLRQDDQNWHMHLGDQENTKYLTATLSNNSEIKESTTISLFCFIQRDREKLQGQV